MEKSMEIMIDGKDFQTLTMQLQTRGVRFKIGNAPTRIILEEGWDLWKVTEALEVVGLAEMEIDTDFQYEDSTREQILKKVRADGPMRTSAIAKHFNASFSYVMGILDDLGDLGITQLIHDRTVYWLTEKTLLGDIDRIKEELREHGPMRIGTLSALFDDRWDANYMLALAVSMKKLGLVEWNYDPTVGRVLLFGRGSV